MTTKGCFFAAIVLGAVSSAIFAGPAPMNDNTKDKEIPVTQEQVCDPRWYISLGGGGDFNVGNNALVQELPTRFIAPFTTAFIQGADFSDVYDTGWHAEGEIGYALTQHLEVFGSFRYAQASADNRATGSRFISDFRPIGGPLDVFPVSIAFDDYNSWGGELGFRFFFFPRQARFRPYAALSGGASHVDSIDISGFADFSAIGGPSDFRVYHGPFFGDSWVGTGAAVLGVEFNLTCRWTLGVNGGIRYASRLESDDSGINRTDIPLLNPPVSARFADPINNDAGDRWSVPVTGYLKFRF